MKKSNLYLVLAFTGLVLSTLACASGNPHASPEAPAGFLKGFWDGLTIGISWIISWFNSNYGIYETFNNGGGYNFGFMVGNGFVGTVIGAIFSRR